MRRTIACRDCSVETVLSCTHPGGAVRTERAFHEWGACVSFLSLQYTPLCGFGFTGPGTVVPGGEWMWPTSARGRPGERLDTIRPCETLTLLL